jgi:DNA-directed RNA polymerase specialized sigma24 family protein
MVRVPARYNFPNKLIDTRHENLYDTLAAGYDELNISEKSIILLKYGQKPLTYREIARVLKKPITTLHYEHRKILRKLRKAFKKLNRI